LSNDYGNMGQWDKALVEQQESLRLAPNLVAYSNLGLYYLILNRPQEAKATFDEALAHKLDGGSLRGMMYLSAFLQADAAQMEQQVAWAAGKPGDEDPSTVDAV
jgi:eukaryotic-like serine/threonine-protein kinase